MWLFRHGGSLCVSLGNRPSQFLILMFGCCLRMKLQLYPASKSILLFFLHKYCKNTVKESQSWEETPIISLNVSGCSQSFVVFVCHSLVASQQWRWAMWMRVNRPEVMFTRFFCQRLHLNLSFKLVAWEHFQLFVRISQEFGPKLVVGSMLVVTDYWWGMDWLDRLLIDRCVFRHAHAAVIVVCLCASRMSHVAAAEWDPQLASHTDRSDLSKSRLFSLKVTPTFDSQVPVLRSHFTASREKHRPCLRCFSPLEPRSQSARQRPTQDLTKHDSINFFHCFSSCLVPYKWKTCSKDRHLLKLKSRILYHKYTAEWQITVKEPHIA